MKKYCTGCGKETIPIIKNRQTKFDDKTGEEQTYGSLVYICPSYHSHWPIVIIALFILAFFTFLFSTASGLQTLAGISTIVMLFSIPSLAVANEVQKDSKHTYFLDVSNINTEISKLEKYFDTKKERKVKKMPRFFRFTIYFILVLILWKLYANFETIFTTLTKIPLAR